MDHVVKPDTAPVNLFRHPAKRPVDERKTLKQHLPEMLWAEKLIRKHSRHIQCRIEHTLMWDGISLPLYSLTLGNQNNPNGSVLYTAGIHGVERIGTQVLLSWTEAFLERLRWDKTLQSQLENIQIVIMPIVNPVGMYNNWRANGNGIDLNRNAPIDAEGRAPMLLGGHRISRRLPWYRGRKGDEMEAEGKALERVIDRQIVPHPFAMCLDLHSGFGFHDFLWMPYAYRRKPIPNMGDYMALKLLWERCYPQTHYVFEPQSNHYTSHGDLWDYFHRKVTREHACQFIPLTLEMGSWNWIKKRPRQLFSFEGLFNPMMTHRYHRVLRRHMLLLDFLLSATASCQNWLPNTEERTNLKHLAKELWFKHPNNKQP